MLHETWKMSDVGSQRFGKRCAMKMSAIGLYRPLIARVLLCFNGFFPAANYHVTRSRHLTTNRWKLTSETAFNLMNPLLTTCWGSGHETCDSSLIYPPIWMKQKTACSTKNSLNLIFWSLFHRTKSSAAKCHNPLAEASGSAHWRADQRYGLHTSSSGQRKTALFKLLSYFGPIEFVFVWAEILPPVAADAFRCAHGTR